jgi:hypothetical protein
MNWDQIQGDWVQFKAGVRGNWVKITDEDLTRIGAPRRIDQTPASALRLQQE